MLSPINYEVSKYFLSHINEIPLVSIKETSTHYMVALDLPDAPETDLQKKTYFQFHDESQSCRTIYQDGVLWLAMPKYAEKSLGVAS